MHTKPFSQACENNKAVILAHLQRLFKKTHSVLEIGSGTGQHAVFFTQALAHIRWQTSDREINHAGINAWIDEQPQANLIRPIELDVLTSDWPKPVDAIYSANTAHIMPWQAVQAMFDGVSRSLAHKGLFVLYGPFNYHGQFSSPSNARFDEHLRTNNAEQGIRHHEDICALAIQVGLTLIEDNAMPANNQLLVFTREASCG
ncbi:DUF938 domain-containing protein [Marinagarivorans algicola]|uniref:DUF938 domain-containing protein n=1 Tax=Marinagarivorans algicola TaxID=1513270 RepID=UPI003735E0F3